MAVNRFVLNGMSFHGHGAINEIPGIVASKGFKKAFVASDPDLVKFGVTAKVTDLLEKNGIAFVVYSNIKPNPTIQNVQEGVDAYKASGADFMITIGADPPWRPERVLALSSIIRNSTMFVLWKVLHLPGNARSLR